MYRLVLYRTCCCCSGLHPAAPAVRPCRLYCTIRVLYHRHDDNVIKLMSLVLSVIEPQDCNGVWRKAEVNFAIAVDLQLLSLHLTCSMQQRHLGRRRVMWPSHLFPQATGRGGIVINSPKETCSWNGLSRQCLDCEGDVSSLHSPRRKCCSQH